jgi:HEAT repeat protein
MPSYVNTAYYGDLSTLKREIGAAQAAGRIDRSAVVELAEAVARREVRSAKGANAVDDIRASRICVGTVETELREWAESSEDAGGEALLVLVESGRVSKEALVRRYAHASSGAFRAVAARGTGTPANADLRRAYFTDPDERVRRAALRAATEARDPADFDLLLDAARLDPDPMNRALAIRAAGGSGGAGAALALKDLWSTADDQGRLAIVEAWALPAVFDQGGGAELVRLAESRSSIASVAAAGALVRVEKAGEREGRAVLARAVADGTTDERMLAIELVSVMDPSAVDALDHAAKSADPAVRAVALARLTEVPARRRAALGELEQLAKGNDGAARQARVALAAAGDASAAPLLERDLADAEPAFRTRAAVGLFRLGRPGAMASALADSDPSVRMSVACSVAGRS